MLAAFCSEFRIIGIFSNMLTGGKMRQFRSAMYYRFVWIITPKLLLRHKNPSINQCMYCRGHKVSSDSCRGKKYHSLPQYHLDIATFT